jgi:hypothetical protein
MSNSKLGFFNSLRCGKKNIDPLGDKKELVLSMTALTISPHAPGIALIMYIIYL